MGAYSFLSFKRRGVRGGGGALIGTWAPNGRNTVSQSENFGTLILEMMQVLLYYGANKVSEIL